MRSELIHHEVVVAVIVKNDHVALVLRSVPEGNLMWQFPSGKIERGEVQKSAVVREVREETGLICQPCRKLGERWAPERPVKLHYWICDYLSGNLEVKTPREIREVRWASGKGSLNLITSDIYEPLKVFLLQLPEEWTTLRTARTATTWNKTEHSRDRMNELRISITVSKWSQARIIVVSSWQTTSLCVAN